MTTTEHTTLKLDPIQTATLESAIRSAIAYLDEGNHDLVRNALDNALYVIEHAA